MADNELAGGDMASPASGTGPAPQGAEPASPSQAKPLVPDAAPTLYCSFCSKSQHDVRKLIAGPTSTICNECVDLCDEIIRHEAEWGEMERRLNAFCEGQGIKPSLGLIGSMAWVLGVSIDFKLTPRAQGIETGTAATKCGPEGESPVAEGDASNLCNQQDNPHDQ